MSFTTASLILHEKRHYATGNLSEHGQEYCKKYQARLTTDKSKQDINVLISLLLLEN